MILVVNCFRHPPILPSLQHPSSTPACPNTVSPISASSASLPGLSGATQPRDPLHPPQRRPRRRCDLNQRSAQTVPYRGLGRRTDRTFVAQYTRHNPLSRSPLDALHGLLTPLFLDHNRSPVIRSAHSLHHAPSLPSGRPVALGPVARRPCPVPRATAVCRRGA